jgi:hypothetical protein
VSRNVEVVRNLTAVGLPCAGASRTCFHMAKRKHPTFRIPTPGEVTKTMLADGTQQWLFTGRAADEVRRGLELQRAAFVAKFGREPRPDDPVFFDPNADEPRPGGPNALKSRIIKAMRTAGLPERFVYAYEQTGVLVTVENEALHDPVDVAAWYLAVARHDARFP